jgi:hypothetical protein
MVPPVQHRRHAGTGRQAKFRRDWLWLFAWGSSPLPCSRVPHVASSRKELLTGYSLSIGDHRDLPACARPASGRYLDYRAFARRAGNRLLEASGSGARYFDARSVGPDDPTIDINPVGTILVPIPSSSRRTAWVKVSAHERMDKPQRPTGKISMQLPTRLRADSGCRAARLFPQGRFAAQPAPEWIEPNSTMYGLSPFVLVPILLYFGLPGRHHGSGSICSTPSCHYRSVAGAGGDDRIRRRIAFKAHARQYDRMHAVRAGL